MNIERNQRPMETLPGSVGTGASLALRVSQTIFATASLIFMSLAVPFYGYTSFCFLVTIMALVIPWSFTLALVDGYYVLVKSPVCRPGTRIVLFIVMGDWVLSTLTLAGACSTASIVDLLVTADVPHFTPKVCNRYQISSLMAFLSWSLSLASSLVNLWLLPYM